MEAYESSSITKFEEPLTEIQAYHFVRAHKGLSYVVGKVDLI